MLCEHGSVRRLISNWSSYEARLLASEAILGVGELGLSVLNSIGNVMQVC